MCCRILLAALLYCCFSTAWVSPLDWVPFSNSSNTSKTKPNTSKTKPNTTGIKHFNPCYEKNRRFINSLIAGRVQELNLKIRVHLKRKGLFIVPEGATTRPSKIQPTATATTTKYIDLSFINLLITESVNKLKEQIKAKKLSGLTNSTPSTKRQPKTTLNLRTTVMFPPCFQEDDVNFLMSVISKHIEKLKEQIIVELPTTSAPTRSSKSPRTTTTFFINLLIAEQMEKLREQIRIDATKNDRMIIFSQSRNEHQMILLGIIATLLIVLIFVTLYFGMRRKNTRTIYKEHFHKLPTHNNLGFLKV